MDAGAPGGGARILRSRASAPRHAAGATARCRRRLCRSLLTGLAVLLASGCYTSRTLAPGAARPPAGADVEVRLTPAGSVRLAEAAGRTERVLHGTLQEDPSDVLVLAVSSVQEGRTIAAESLRQLVVVPWTDVQELNVREFSAARTVGMAAVGAAVAYALVRLAFGRAEEDGGTPEPPPGEVPLTWGGWRIPIGP